MNLVPPTTPVTSSVDDLITSQCLEVPTSQGVTSKKPLAEIAKLMNGLAAESRLQLLFTLRDHGEMTLAELARLTGQTQPNVSFHMKILRTVGLVSRHPGRSGKYYINGAGFQRLRSIIQTLLTSCASIPLPPKVEEN